MTLHESDERELLRRQARLELVIRGTLDPLITIDPRGKIQSTSDSCTVVFGYERDELIGANIKLLMPEPYRSEHDGYLEQYHATGITEILGRTREFPVLRKDGREITIALSVSRIDVPGEPEPIFCGTFRDVTERKAAERALAESERRFRAIFDGEFQFVGLLATDGTTLEVNRTALEKTGVKREEAIGRLFWDTPWWSHSEAARETARDAVLRAARGEFVRCEIEVGGPTDVRLWIDFSVKPMLDDAGKVELLIPEGRDITEIKRAQQRQTAMLGALAEIGEASSLLAHEIKNPITAVNLALRAVASKLGEDEQAVLREHVARMQKLERLMRRTLSFARPLELQRVPNDPRERLTNSVAMLAPELEARKVEVEIVGDPGALTLYADPELVEELLTNLLRNAIDALDGAGHIRMETRREGDVTSFIVDDDGPGIEAGIRETLFKAFVTSKVGGTGIGLALSRKIADAHGGSIEVDDAPLGGARFLIRFPDSG